MRRVLDYNIESKPFSEYFAELKEVSPWRPFAYSMLGGMVGAVLGQLILALSW